MRLSLVCLVIVSLPSCHSAPSLPVPVGGDILALAGEWDGTYEARDGSRQGVIDFHLRAGSDTAYGDVMMIPRGGELPVSPAERAGEPVREGVPPRLLSIRFVRISNGELSGELDPHQDPECGCVIHTVFRGRLLADTLKGKYVSLDQNGASIRDGRWRVERKSVAN